MWQLYASLGRQLPRAAPFAAWKGENPFAPAFLCPARADVTKGADTEAPLAERIEIGLFTAEPGRDAFDQSNVVLMEVTGRKPSYAGVDPYNFSRPQLGGQRPAGQLNAGKPSRGRPPRRPACARSGRA
jgi:hypothetical protein